MNLADMLILLSIIATVMIGYIRQLNSIGWITSILLAMQFALLIMLYPEVQDGNAVDLSLSLEFFQLSLHWQFDAVAWFFAIITVGAALASSVFAAAEWGEWFKTEGGHPGMMQFTLSLNVTTMLILLASGDMVSLFIGWELVSWASFAIMLLAGGASVQYSIKYIIYATAGAMAVIAAMAMLYNHSGSLEFSALTHFAEQQSDLQLFLLVMLLFAGFAVKMALLPFHLWQANAYAETPGPGAAFLGAISSRMGLFAMLVVMVKWIGLQRIVDLDIPFSLFDTRDMLLWLAAFTIILPTYTALRQNDARRLLAWHGIGQGGYMLMGILLLNPVGSAGGMLHVFNYATNQAALFLAVTAVVYRTRTADLNSLGGLVTRMPLTYLVLLCGIIGLAGIPPMNGFVSKWLVYRSLIMEGMPLLFLATVIGTLGTILSVYKLIHNIFLGQLRLEHESVREVPLSMLLPMLALATVVFITGFMPGLVLEWVAQAQAALGLPVLEYTLGGVETSKGSLDMIWIVSVLFGGFAVGAVLFYSGNRAKRVHQLDNYAGGHFLTADTRYHYSNNFYAGLMHHIGGWYRDSFTKTESAILSGFRSLSGMTRLFYQQAQPGYYLLLAITLLLYLFVGTKS